MQLSFFGAAPDTGNLGVSALCFATLYNLSIQKPDFKFTIFDFGRGQGKQTISFSDELQIEYSRQGAMNSRRIYRQENLKLAKFLGIFGGLGNPCIKTIRESQAVLDISGGDSFTDLYGKKRFDSVSLPKRIAIQQKVPLILLPQTYGPFSSSRCKQQAKQIVERAQCAFARDKRSFEVLKELLGNNFDQNRHYCGVDMAFGLPTVTPQNQPKEISDFLAKDTIKIGINVSGLIYNQPANAKNHYGFKASYNEVLLQLLRKFLKETDCNIALVSHVNAPLGHYESDLNSCRDIKSLLEIETKDRLFVVPSFNNPCEIKWFIEQLDWFCGTRMHAAIAALSSSVPVSAISYSPKTLGVFESCGQGRHVADPTLLQTDEMVDYLWKSWESRLEAKEIYQEKLPEVKSILQEQNSTLSNIITTL